MKEINIMLEKIIDWACKSDLRIRFLMCLSYGGLGLLILAFAFNIYLLITGNY